MKLNNNRNEEPVSQTPEQWWAGLKPLERLFTQQIALCIEEVADRKRLEIRKEMGEIRARFIHVLTNPEPGCVRAIILPEMPAERGN